MIKQIKSIYNRAIMNLNSTEIFAFYSFYYILIFSILCLTINYLSQKTILTPKYNTEITVASIQDINTLLPSEEKNTTEKIISSLLYSGILKKNSTEHNDNSYQNNLAESVIFDEDYRNIDIKLKDDIYFSDGSPILSDDIIWTYKISKNISHKYNIIMEGINIQKIDDKNIKISLTHNYPEIKEVLTLGIMSKKHTEILENDINKIQDYKISNVYSGLYTINNLSEIQNYNIYTKDETEQEDYKYFELKANKYNIHKPFIKYIHFNIYKDNITLNTDLEQNNIDIVLNYNKIQNNIDKEFLQENYKTVSYLLPINNGLFLNSRNIKEFAKVETRKEIYNVINRLEILNNISTLQATTTYDIIPSSKNTDLIQTDLSVINDINDYRIEKTNNTTQKDRNKTINLYVVDTESNIKLADYLKNKIENLKTFVSYSVNIHTKTPAEITNDIIKNRNFDMLVYGIEVDNYSGLYLFLHSSQLSYPGLNITANPSSKRDSILQKIKNSKNIEEQSKLLKDLTVNFYEEYPFIPLYSNSKNILIKKDFELIQDIDTQTINDESYLFANISNISTNKDKVWPIFYNTKLEQILNKILH